MVNGEYRVRRINEIPHIIKELKKEHKRCVALNWIGAAAGLRKQIENLEQEFSELYDSFRKERQNADERN